jgi:UDP-glucose 4-epimerase
VIARLFNTVGPRQSGQYGNVVPRFVEAALAGRPLEVHGDGTQTRCFCHVSDTVRALQALMEGSSTTGQIYNVGSTERVRIGDLAERVRLAAASSSEIVFVPYEEVFDRGIEEEMFHRAPSIEKIAAAVGWRPTIDLDGILADIVDHARAASPTA